MKKVTMAIGSVLALLLLTWAGAAVALRLGWNPPPWISALTGKGKESLEDAGLFCREHGVPEKFCTLCHAELKETLQACKEHGLPEAICTICDPTAVARYGLTAICTEHHLPKHFCSGCDPRLAGETVASDWCGEHGVPKSLCLRCSPELSRTVQLCAPHGAPAAICSLCRPELARSLPVPAKNATSAATLPVVKLVRPEVAQKAGFESKLVRESTTAAFAVGTGEVGFDQTRLGLVRARVQGVVLEVPVSNGDLVEKGQVLAVLDSADLGAAKADFLAALPLVELWEKALERKRKLAAASVPAREIQEAEAELRRAQAEQIRSAQRLRSFGLTEEELGHLALEDAAQRNRLKIVAPLGGTVIRRKVVIGEAVEAMSEIFAVADLLRLWAEVDVAQRDAGRVLVGQPVELRASGIDGAIFSGKVIWIEAEASKSTRGVRVRVEIENPSGLLRANMFVTAEIQIEKPKTSLLVPREATQWEGSSYVVFVESGPGRYEPRRVVLGRQIEDELELAWGTVQAGDRVITTGSFLLKTEIQKGAIGAGCCGE